MPATMSPSPASSLRELPENAGPRAKAGLRKAASDDFRLLVGQCIDQARRTVGWSLKELSAALAHDERQIARWIAGTEHPQLDALFAVAALRAPLVLALAALAEDVTVTTQITIRRSA